MELTIGFENFRCLKNTRIRLSGLTVLVGPNSSGKSTVLRSLTAEITDQDAWQQKQDCRVTIWVQNEQGHVSRRVREPNSAARSDTRFWTTQTLHLDLTSLRQHVQAAQQSSISTDGSNLVNVFGTLTRNQQQSVVARFCELVPVFGDVLSRPSGGGRLRLVFQDRWNESVWYEPEEVSDGSLLTLAFLLISYQQPVPDVVAIEEPERGLHPYLIQQLVDLLRRLTQGQLGPAKPIVVLATHSPQVVDCAKPEELRFLNRNPDGSTRIDEAPVTEAGWKDVWQAYEQSMSGMWLAGGLGGVPSSNG